MTKRELAILAFRLLAVWSAFYAVLRLDMVIGMWQVTRRSLVDEGMPIVVLSFLPLVLGLIVAWLIWSKAAALADRVGLAEPEPARGTPLTAETAMMVAFCAIGAYALILGLPRIGQTILHAVLIRDYAQMDTWYFTVREGAAALLQVGLGLWLLFGGRGLARFVHRVRTAGLPQDSHNP
ncbi:MAG: hypothetical protein GXY33_10880 [Phycisphaerae bacterium]|nr:hypothetical protein [Phycisphaerae bacterium]